eukprot:12628642-Ditylum_brightwellii.AAC.1
MIALPNFAITYKSLLEQQLILPGWHRNFIPAAAAAHVSATGLTCDCPDSLLKALAPTFSNRVIWHKSYMEELNGLIKLGTFHEISLDEYQQLCDKGAPKALPSMCVLNVKHNENGNPVQAKSRIIVL